jgi:hypothetical protein
MGMRNPLGESVTVTPVTDTLIGNAYPTVKLVAEYLDDIRYVAANMEGIIALVQGNLNVVDVTITGKLTLTSNTLDSLTVRGGGVFGPSDYRNFEILPETTANGPTGMPQVVVARRVGSDATVGVAGNLWVSQSGWVLTDTSAPAGVRFNSLVSTSAGAGVDPGEVWGLTSLLSTQASTDSLNAVSVYGQAVRRGLPVSGVGVPVLAGVFEARSMTGESSSTDGRLRSVELDIFANGADDFTPGPGREALVIVLDKHDLEGDDIHVASLVGAYGGLTAGATIDTGFRVNNITWNKALFDGRGGTQGASAHTLWLNTNQSIGLDTTGTLGAANTKISSNGTTITVTGAAMITDALTSAISTTSKILYVGAGAQSLTGNYTNPAAPFAISMTLPRVNVDPPLGARDIMRITSANDVAYPQPNGNQAGSLTLLDVLMQSGVQGGAVADSWGGSRVVAKFTWADVGAPVESLEGPGQFPGRPGPGSTATWSTVRMRHNRGGTAAEHGYARGGTLVDYAMVSLETHTATNSKPTNYINTRLYEGGLMMASGTSTKVYIGHTLQVVSMAGTVPVEHFGAYNSWKKGSAIHGFRTVYGLGNIGYAGVDPLQGAAFSFWASHADPYPTAKFGMDLKDVYFRGAAITWAGGDISGGEHSTVGTGRIRVGNGFIVPTSTGLQINAVGYVGRASGTYLSKAGGTIVNANPGMPGRNKSIGDDAYGGTYLFLGWDADTNEFATARVINPPVVQGSAPVGNIEVKLRANSAARVEYMATGTATTTSHPAELTASIEDFYVGRRLTYETGVCAGESRAITAWDPDTRILTTDAFTTSPTASVNVVTNSAFASAIPTVYSTLISQTTVNSWQITKNGGTGTVQRVTGPTYVILTGDGTNAAGITQNITLPANTDAQLYVTGAGSYRIKIGSAWGESDLLDEEVEGIEPDEDDNVQYAFQDVRFHTGSVTSIWITIENHRIRPVNIRNLRCADLVSGLSMLFGVRAVVEAQPLTVTQVWTQRNLLELQSDGGPASFGGTLNVADNFSVATNKLTVNATTGNVAVAGTISVTGNSSSAAYIPTSATVPTNGMYLPAANTLGWAINSTGKLRLDAAALFPSTSDGLALGKSTNGFADLYLAFGGSIDWDNSDVTIGHTTNNLIFQGGRFLFGSATDDASTTLQVNGTLKATGATTLAALSATSAAITGASSINLSGTSLGSISGTVLGLAAADAASTGLLIESKAANPKIVLRRANNTSASPAALALNDVIAAIEARGHDGSTYTVSRATMEAVAAEAWTGSAQGAYWQWRTAAIGGTTSSVRMTLGDTGNLTLLTGYLLRVSSNTGTATGTTRTDALQLSGDFKRLSNVASGTGVILPTGVIGMSIVIVHSGANPVKVYANGSETIDGVAGITGVTLTNGNRCLYWFSAANTWHSMMFNGTSA